MTAKHPKTVDGVTVPTGFAATVGESDAGTGRRLPGILSDDGFVRIQWESTYRMGTREYADRSGHTYYRTGADGYWFCFDRRGLDDSFYFKSRADLEAQLPAQIERARKVITVAREPHFAVPGLPYSLRAERKAELSRQLQQRGAIRLTPHGMGTAHQIATRQQSRWDREGSAELARYFGVARCWISELDWD